MDLDPIHGYRSPFVIGALGALVAALRFMPGTTLGAKVAHAICGCLIAGFLAPATVAFMHWEGPSIFGGIAFLWGLIGVSLIQGLMNWVNSTKLGEAISSWMVRK